MKPWLAMSVSEHIQQILKESSVSSCYVMYASQLINLNDNNGGCYGMMDEPTPRGWCNCLMNDWEQWC